MIHLIAPVALLRWWLNQFSASVRRALHQWIREPEWPLLVCSALFSVGFLLHWLGYRLAIHRVGWPEPFFAETNWEGRVGWRKPIVFCISNALVFVSLRQALRAQRLVPRGFVSHLAAWSTLVEVGIITVQAWRAVPSHFNTSTSVDALLYGVKLCGAALLSIACVAAALGVFLKPLCSSALQLRALRHGMALLCVAIAVGIAQVYYGHLAREARDEEHEACLEATAGASQSPCYEIHGQARVKLAHFLPLHATEVLLLLVWAIGRISEDTYQHWLSVAAFSCWSIAVIGIWFTWQGEDMKNPSFKVAAITILSLAPVPLAFIMIFFAPLWNNSQTFGTLWWKKGVSGKMVVD